MISNKLILAFNAALLFSWALFLPSPAKADIELCNQTGKTLVYASVFEKRWGEYSSDPIIWIMRGWYTLEDGECDLTVSAQRATKAYFSILEDEENHALRIIHYAEDSSIMDKGHGRSGAWEVFCVNGDEEMDIYAERLDLHRECQEGQNPQIFNVFVKSEANSLYTLNLK